MMMMSSISILIIEADAFNTKLQGNLSGHCSYDSGPQALVLLFISFGYSYNH